MHFLCYRKRRKIPHTHTHTHTHVHLGGFSKARLLRNENEYPDTRTAGFRIDSSAINRRHVSDAALVETHWHFYCCEAIKP